MRHSLSFKQNSFAKIGSRLAASRAGVLYICAAFMCFPQSANAGEFTMNLGTNPNWVSGATSQTFVLTDENGFELTGTGTIAQVGGTSVAGFPINEVGFFGTAVSIGLIWDSNAGSSGIGESTNTASLSFSSGGSPLPVDSLSFVISDIDTVDNNSGTDRCDFVTATGNAGSPSLSLVNPATTATSVRIGPATGSGSTGSINANQAQCIYNAGATASPNSTGDDNGSILATWPSGTSTATISYDESIENVVNNSNLNAAARGIGIWAATIITVDQSISLAKTSDTQNFSSDGQTITYTYTITNDGPLPINTDQTIQVSDDQIGIINCPAITSDIPVGGTYICTATDETDAADVSATSITNIAIAGIGTSGQDFDDRLQSNSSTVKIDLEAPAMTLTKSAQAPTTASGASSTLTDVGDTIAYSYSVSNTGNVALSNVSISDVGPTFNGNAGTGTLSAITPASANIAVGSSQTFSASYALSQTDIDNAATLTNGVNNSAQANGATSSGTATASNTSTATTSIGGGADFEITKTADQTSNVTVGTVVTYTYRVTNTGNQTITNISLADLHNASGPSPTPTNEVLASDNGPSGDSSDSAVDGTWDSLAPADQIEFSASYTVTQSDVDTLQ